MRTSHRLIGALGALLLVSGLALAPTARGTEDFSLARVAGVDRYATAAEIAVLAFPSGADAVVLARGDAFPDALAGNYLTGVLGAPVLLTTPTELPAVTEDAIETLGAEVVYLLGGTSAISTGVEEALAADHDVVRVAGNDRYGTAYEIAHVQDSPVVGELDEGRTAIVASGISFADALAAGPMAHAAGLPVLLTTAGALPAPTRTALEDLDIEHVVVAGGTAVVSAAVVAAIEDLDISTERVAGVNRYATAAEIADFALDNIPDWNNDAVDLATGEKFADALAAGPAAGEENRSILLTASAVLSAEAQAWLSAHAGTLVEGRVFGGTAAVAESVVAAAEAAGRGQTGGPQSGQLTFIDKADDWYRFVPTGATKAVVVDYESGDTFTVDGAAATMGGFETNASPADQIRHVPATGTTAARHELTNVDASTITSGMVGNVDTGDTEFDIINAVSGDALRSNLDWSAGTFTVDGSAANAEAFGEDINEGDTIAITGSAFALTNEDLTRAARDITVANLPPTTRFMLGALGDEHATSSDGGTDPDGPGNDSHFQASGNPITSSDTFSGDVDNYDDFADQLTPGDVVTYSREGDVQNFHLVNATPTTETGQGVDDLAADGDGDMDLLTPSDNDGGAFTLATADGAVAVEYEAGGTFVVNGSVGDEGDFEAAYTPGDEISFRAADGPSGTTQRLQLTNRVLAGEVPADGVSTADDTYDVLAANGETVLATVTYVGDEGANTYFVNGATATLEAFEAALDEVAAETKDGVMQVVVSGAVTQHRLATSAP